MKRIAFALRQTLPLIATNLTLLFALLAPIAVQAQQPTAEQMRMLNQLPPSQRQAAMQALRDFQAQSSGGESGAGKPLREDPAAGVPLQLFSETANQPEEQERRAEAGSRLVVTLTPKESLTSDELGSLEADDVLSRLRGSNAFTLDDAGMLSLMGLQSVPLLGLTESDVERRLRAEPLLAPFEIDARILDSQPTGVDALKPFGYEIFEPRDASFDAPTTGPVPPDYVLGPGDSVRVQLFGNVNNVYEYSVSRDGILNLPELGPITVAGLPFSELREDLEQRVQEMLIGTQVSVTMGELRTIRVFVLGDVNQPGSYVVNSLATISGALYRSGGISPVGSLRNIQLKRRGKLVAQLDLYDLLINGDTSNDSRLQPGDVIFVPALKSQVSVYGEVKRPAIYEAKGNASVADLVELAGGLLPEAFPAGGRIERIDDNRDRKVISLDVASEEASTTKVRAGDVILVPRVLPDVTDSVTLSGHVHRPGPQEWRRGMRLTDLIHSALVLKPGADLDYVMIRREDPKTRYVSVVSANLRNALADPGSLADIRLQPRDTVYVFNLTAGRQRVIAPIMEELEQQSRHGDPQKVVHVEGQVIAPGTYPLEPNMRVSDLIRAGGALSEQAYTLEAELTRYSVVNDEYRVNEVIEVDLDRVLDGQKVADLMLNEHDHLHINTIPQWDSEWTVELVGEVTFPGKYRIRRGETLRQILERAGGLTDQAFPEGAIFLREDLREREQEQIDMLVRRMETDLASLSLQSVETSGPETLSTGSALLQQLRETEAVGRLVIDLEKVLSDARASQGISVELRSGDRLLVPTKSQVVTVIGEVQQSTSHLYRPNLARDDYLDMSGGTTRRADEKLIYIVRANGAVVTGNSSRWFANRQKTEIRPGDTIVVPLETDRIRPLTFWGSVTQILYQGAIAVSAIKTFSN